MSGNVLAQVLRVDINMNECVVLGNRVVRRGDLAVPDPDGQDQVNILEGGLRGPCALLAVAPAHGQRMTVGNASLAADRGGHRGLQHLGDGGQGRAGIGTSQPGVDADPAPAVV